MKTLAVTSSLIISLSGIVYAGCDPPSEWPRVEKYYGGVASCPNYELIEASVDFWTIHEPPNRPTMAIAYNHWDGSEVWRCNNMMDLVDWNVTGHKSWQTTCRNGAIRVQYDPPSWTLDLTAKVDMSRYIPGPYRGYPQKSFGKYGVRRRIYTPAAAIVRFGIDVLRGMIWLYNWLKDAPGELLDLIVDAADYLFFGHWEPGQFGD